MFFFIYEKFDFCCFNKNVFLYRGTSIVKPSKPGNSSGSDSDNESTHSSISLTDDKYQKHPPRQSFISERKSFKVFKSNYI